MSKFCPILKQPLIKCRQELCAWYLVKSKQCAIPLIASRLGKIKLFVPDLGSSRISNDSWPRTEVTIEAAKKVGE